MTATGPQDSEEDQPGPRDVDRDGDYDFRDAAILAEMDVTKHEETVDEAWHHVLVRIGRMAAGFGLLGAGVAMFVLPGPGILAIASGLVILAKDFVWADRALRYMRDKVPGMEEEGPIPRSTLIVSGLLLLAGALVAVWWFGFGGQEAAGGWFDSFRDWIGF